jgi:gamma-glutamyltranspeptidase/glutathione hydrolase
MKLSSILTWFGAAGIVVLSVGIQAAIAADPLPEAVETRREMIVTANPLATAAGASILNRGGTAVDAMIAAQTVLGLVEPQSSGIGGGAFVVYYDADTGDLTTFDAREKAPMTAEPDRFLDENGNSRGFFANWQSGLSVGVPSIPLLMETLHDRYGRLQYQTLFNPAKALAQGGFAITGRTSDQVNTLLGFNDGDCVNRLFFRDPTAFEYFTNGATTDCAAKPEGTIVKNKDYADLMKILAKQGADGFYSGPVAKAIATAVQTDLNIPGDMTIEDLAKYTVVERTPVCIVYRGYDVCGMGPPSSGGLAVGQILGILENFDLGSEPLDPDTVHHVAQAGGLAFADRNLYVGDSDFVDVPIAGMLDKTYLYSRFMLINPMMDGTSYDPGVPDGAPASAADPSLTDNGTSHISIVDRYGNALSMTTTIESSFGNGVMVPGYGFLLNNQLTDFAFFPETSDGMLVANRVQPEKRPRSSMSPTIVFDAFDDVFLVTGSPGGSRIIGYTSQSIINVIDFGLDPQEAINVPHYLNRNGSTDIEEPIPGTTLDYDADALAGILTNEYGYINGNGTSRVNIRALTSGLSIIQVGDGLVGGADQRRDGTVGGR